MNTKLSNGKVNHHRYLSLAIDKMAENLTRGAYIESIGLRYGGDGIEFECWDNNDLNEK